MKITIDTKEDSHQEIQKVLGLLTDLLNKENRDPRHRSFSEPEISSPVQENTDTTSMMSMFGSPAETEEIPEIMSQNEPIQESVPDTPPDFTSFLSLADKQEEKKEQEEAKVEFF